MKTKKVGRKRDPRNIKRRTIRIHPDYAEYLRRRKEETGESYSRFVSRLLESAMADSCHSTSAPYRYSDVASKAVCFTLPAKTNAWLSKQSNATALIEALIKKEMKC